MNDQIRSGQNGFSLVEILVATVILSVGLLAMASSTAYVSTQLKSTTYTTQRTQARQRMVEELRAITWDSVSNNSTGRTVGRYSMTWSVTTSGLTKRVSLVTSGPAYLGRSNGARITKADTMTFDIVSP